MSQLITDPKKAVRVLATLQNNVSVEEVSEITADWVLQNPIEAGKQFTLFLKNRAHVLIGEIKKTTIDRTPFNPAEYFGFSIWKGPANGGGLEGEEEQDKRSLARTELDITSLRLETTLKPGENSIKGEEKINRRKAMVDVVPLDAAIWLTFRKNEHLIPERFKEKTNGNTTYIFCDGTVLRGPDGGRCVLCFYWRAGRQQWGWHYRRLGLDFRASRPSVVSPQVSAQN